MLLALCKLEWALTLALWILRRSTASYRLLPGFQRGPSPRDTANNTETALNAMFRKSTTSLGALLAFVLGNCLLYVRSYD